MISIVGTTTAKVDGAVYRTERHASVYHKSQPAKVDGAPCISESLFITTSMVDHDEEENKAEFNCT